MMRTIGLIAFLLALLPGCPPPSRLTGQECATSEARVNCGQCSSQPVCAWCASDITRGCFDRTSPFVCDGTIVRLPEGCEYVPESQIFMEVSE